MEASSNDTSLQTLQLTSPRSTTIANRDSTELSRKLPDSHLWFNKWMDVQTKHQHTAEDLQRERDQEWITLAKEKIDRKAKTAEQLLIDKAALMQIRIAEGAKTEKKLLEERQALLKKWRESDQNFMKEKHLQEGIMLTELFKMYTERKDKQGGGCGKVPNTHTPPESPEDPLALVHDPDQSLEHPTMARSKGMIFAEGARSPGRPFDSPTTSLVSMKESARQLGLGRDFRVELEEADKKLKSKEEELEEVKEKLKSKEELLERAKNNINGSRDLAPQFDANIQQQVELAQQQQLEIQRLEAENHGPQADSGKCARTGDSDTEEENSEEDIDVEGVKPQDVVLWLQEYSSLYVVHCPSICSLWEEQPNVTMAYFTAHLDQEHPRSDSTGWTSEDALVECCILIVDANLDWFATERLSLEMNEKTVGKGKKRETEESKNDSVNKTCVESIVRSRLDVVLLSDKHPSTRDWDERSKEKNRLLHTIDELKRQNQHYMDERGRLNHVLETIKTQDRDVKGKIEEIKKCLENVQEYKEWTTTSDAATQGIQSVPDSTITNGQKRQRETLDNNGDKQTEADKPRPCKKLKTPERTVPATATSSIPSPTSSNGHQDINTALERDTPLCRRCSTSPERRPAQTENNTEEAPSKSTYVSPRVTPPREMNSPQKGEYRAILQFNNDAVASMEQQQARDARTSLGGLENHQTLIVLADL